MRRAPKGRDEPLEAAEASIRRGQCLVISPLQGLPPAPNLGQHQVVGTLRKARPGNWRSSKGPEIMTTRNRTIPGPLFQRKGSDWRVPGIEEILR